MDPHAKLKELGLELPPAPKPFASYRPCVQSGDLLAIAGQGPTRGKELLMTGRLGDDVSLDQGREAARLSVLNALAIVADHAGSLDAVARVVSCTVWVRCTDDFGEQPEVADGATELLRELFGDEGLPARAAVGTNALPRGIPVEVVLTVELRR